MVSVLVGIGIAFIIFSLVIVIMNFSLLIHQAREEIGLLKQLGYRNSVLFGHLSRYFLAFYTASILVSISAFYFLNHWAVKNMVSKGIELSAKTNSFVIITGAVFILLSFMIVMLSIRSNLRKNT